MDRKEFFDFIYDRIENCASLEYVISQMEENKEVLSINDMIRIIRYYNSFDDMKIK